MFTFPRGCAFQATIDESAVVIATEGCRRRPKDAEECRRTPEDAEGRRRMPKEAEGGQRESKEVLGRHQPVTHRKRTTIPCLSQLELSSCVFY